ncbi:MAG: SIMPL domain-containing protein [Cyanobacteria bacterium SZAS LIN-2]|nr:SIMPL domain-containing protein [Cyanobacteria bacterium SZAS LIN-2]
MKKFALIMAISLTLGSAARCEAQSLMSGLLDGLMKRPRTIETRGSATVDVVPDEVVLDFGVTTFNSNMATSSEENDRRTEELLALTKKFKIDESDIQTSSINVKQMHKDYRETTRVLGYQVKRTVTVNIKNLATTAEILKDAVKNGATSIDTMELKTSQLRKYRDQARTEAAKAAKEKAELIAQTLGAALGKVQTIKELAPVDANSNGQIRLTNSSNLIQNTNLFQVEPTVIGGINGSFAAGRIPVQAAVEVTWELE